MAYVLAFLGGAVVGGVGVMLLALCVASGTDRSRDEENTNH